MTNVVLVFPRFKYPSGDIPYGLSIIASFLREKLDVNVTILDVTFNNSLEYVESFLKNKNPDVVGIYANTIAYYDTLKVAEIAKRFCSLLVVGGPHATILPETLIKHKSVDVVAIGEGEFTLKDIVQRFQSGKSLNGINGIWHKEEDKIIKEKRRLPIQDLDVLPFPAWDLLDMKKYLKNWFYLDLISPNLKGVATNVSRGCPFNCSFCQPTLKKIFGEKIRFRSPKNVVEEIKTLKKIYNIDAFIFTDETPTAFRDWVEEFCNLLDKEKLNLFWVCSSRANLIDRDLLKKMKNVGLRKVMIGAESASQRILDDIYNKGIKVEDIKKSAKIAKDLGILVQLSFMIGAPTETREEINRTIKLATSSDADEAVFSITTPLPKTHLYNRAKKLGFKLSEDYNDFDYYSKKSLLSNNLEWNELKKLQKKAFIYFYLNPKRLPFLLKNLTSLRGINNLGLKIKRIT